MHQSVRPKHCDPALHFRKKNVYMVFHFHDTPERYESMGRTGARAVRLPWLRGAEYHFRQFSRVADKVSFSLKASNDADREFMCLSQWLTFLT